MGTTAAAWTVGGALAVTGASTLTGNVTASGTLAVTGTTTLTGALTSTTFNLGTATSGYLTDGNYNWAINDGNGIKMQQLTLMDQDGTWCRVYIVSDALKCEAL
ncbi:MAG: hypothetical protein GY835_23995 [bacterium]|nr:hypothetical protein [bacterium]